MLHVTCQITFVLLSLFAIQAVSLATVSNNNDVIASNLLSVTSEFDEAIERMNQTFRTIFDTPRSLKHNEPIKNEAQMKISNELTSYGLITSSQSFYQDGLGTGKNIFGILPGKYRGTNITDSIILVGAHYDTSQFTDIGTNDNAAGMIAMLELAKMIASKGPLDQTVMFVAFDFEEDGYVGSKIFVEKYFIPEELIEGQATFLGAFIFDNLMIHKSEENSQDIPYGMKEILPSDVLKFLEDNKYRGDFIAAIARPFDIHLVDGLVDEAKNQKDYKLLKLSIPLGEHKTRIPNVIGNFLRSDHRNFWFHEHPVYTSSLPAVFMTDTANYRSQCYHKKCDDFRFLTRENLIFLKNTIDVVARTILNTPWNRE